MAAEPKNRIPESEIIDVTDENQREHWCAEFDVSAEELQRAVIEAGHRVADVRAYFESRANR